MAAKRMTPVSPVFRSGEGVATSQADIIDRFNVLETRHQQDSQKITSLTTELAALKENCARRTAIRRTGSPQRAQPPINWLTSDKTKEQIFMNLVMSDITRNKLGCYMAQQASLNNIPVSALVSRFTVEPSVQQRFENAVKESTEFTKINVFGVTDQKGEKSSGHHRADCAHEYQL